MYSILSPINFQPKYIQKSIAYKAVYSDVMFRGGITPTGEKTFGGGTDMAVPPKPLYLGSCPLYMS